MKNTAEVCRVKMNAVQIGLKLAKLMNANTLCISLPKAHYCKYLYNKPEPCCLLIFLEHWLRLKSFSTTVLLPNS